MSRKAAAPGQQTASVVWVSRLLATAGPSSFRGDGRVDLLQGRHHRAFLCSGRLLTRLLVLGPGGSKRSSRRCAFRLVARAA